MHRLKAAARTFCAIIRDFLLFFFSRGRDDCIYGGLSIGPRQLDSGTSLQAAENDSGRF
jgi:hypothetical protein